MTREGSNETIGQFGIGFYLSLYSLKNAGDCVQAVSKSEWGIFQSQCFCGA